MGGANVRTHVKHNGCGSEATTSAFLAVAEVSVEACVKEVLCCVAFPAKRITELVTMVALIVCTRLANQEHLAGLKVVHRDLATRNVLIDEEMFLKVSDFGLSRDIYSDNLYHMAHTKDKLPVRWMALESIIDREFSIESDVWSFGVVLWEIITCGSFPYYHMTNMEVITGIQDGYRLPKPESCPDKMYDIMKMCWQQTPSQRPSFSDLLGMLDALLDKGEYTSLM